MSQFYISSENPEADLRRCQDSQKFRTWLVITGATERGEIELFEGFNRSRTMGKTRPRADDGG
jgi:hypothetical protein